MHPETNRCELAGRMEIEHYVKLTLRRRPAAFEVDPREAADVQPRLAELLRISPLDVHFNRYQPCPQPFGYQTASFTRWEDDLYPPAPGLEEKGPENTHTCMYFRLSSPFLPSREQVAAELSVDAVYAAFPIPLDRVEVLSREEVDPPIEMPPPPPFLKPWQWGLIVGGTSGTTVICFLYWGYFRRVAYAHTPFKPVPIHDPVARRFLQQAVRNAPTAAYDAVLEGTGM